MKEVSVQNAPLPPRAPNNFIVVLRSVCVGIATTVVAVYLTAIIAIGFASHSLPGPRVTAADGGVEVGWDLVTLVHSLPWRWLLLPGAAFAAGFAFGFRYFSRAHT